MEEQIKSLEQSIKILHTTISNILDITKSHSKRIDIASTRIDLSKEIIEKLIDAMSKSGSNIDSF